MALVTYSYGAKVIDPMPATFGFDKDKLKTDVPNGLPGGTTSMAEGLYRGWDEVRSVANGQQAGLRVIVLFTDGSGNVFPGFLDGSGVAKGVFSGDFPKANPDRPTPPRTNRRFRVPTTRRPGRRVRTGSTRRRPGTAR
jgi:hypothetical protein